MTLFQRARVLELPLLPSPCEIQKLGAIVPKPLLLLPSHGVEAVHLGEAVVDARSSVPSRMDFRFSGVIGIGLGTGLSWFPPAVCWTACSSRHHRRR